MPFGGQGGQDATVPMMNITADTQHTFATTTRYLYFLQETKYLPPLEAYSNTNVAANEAFQAAAGMGNPGANQMDLPDTFRMVNLENDSDDDSISSFFPPRSTRRRQQMRLRIMRLVWQLVKPAAKVTLKRSWLMDQTAGSSSLSMRHACPPCSNRVHPASTTTTCVIAT